MSLPFQDCRQSPDLTSSIQLRLSFLFQAAGSSYPGIRCGQVYDSPVGMSSSGRLHSVACILSSVDPDTKAYALCIPLCLSALEGRLHPHVLELVDAEVQMLRRLGPLVGLVLRK
jgi:hypothetical protein